MRFLCKTLHFTAFLLCLTLLCSVLPVSAAPLELPSMAEANAVYFYHVEGETLVCEKNTDALLPAASTGKVIAGLILCEQLGARLTERVTVTADMIRNSIGHRLGLVAGDELLVQDLLYAAICGSYNDAFDTLACVVGGTRLGFVQMMNQRAAELGAASTQYSDVSGVDDLSRTTAADLGKIALAASQNTLYMTVASERSYVIPSHKSFDNRNKLIAGPSYYNAKCKGMNAGSTKNGGDCVVTFAENDSQHYICVVMGAPTDSDKQYVVANRLISWIGKTYGYMDVITPDTVVCTIPVTHSDITDEVEIRTKDTLTAYLPPDLVIGTDITYSLRLEYTTLEAPVVEGEYVGEVVVRYGDRELGRLPLYTVGSANRSFFKALMQNLQKTVKSRAFLSGLIFFFVSVTAWITVEYIVWRRRRHRWDKYFSDKMTLPPDDTPTARRPQNPQNPAKRG